MKERHWFEIFYAKEGRKLFVDKLLVHHGGKTHTVKCLRSNYHYAELRRTLNEVRVDGMVTWNERKADES